MPRKKYHFVGEMPDGTALVKECGSSDNKMLAIEPMTSGQPVPLGKRPMVMNPGDDPEHIYIQDADDGDVYVDASGNGPAQVATEAYRDGWERCFGAKKAIN